MHNILITKDVALNAGITGIADLPKLEHGSLAIVLDQKSLFSVANDISTFETMQFIVGVAKNSEFGIGLQNSVLIPINNVTDANYEVYKAPVTQIVEIGPFPQAVGTAEGDVGLTINNNSYVRTIQTDRYNLTEYKKASTSLVSILNKIIDRINNGTGLPRKAHYKAFTTASLVGTADANYKIRLEMKSEHVDFSASAYELFEGANIVTVRKAVISKGKGIDVLQAEKEYSGYLGNGGYWGNNEAYYSKPLEADAGGKYDIFNFQFQGLHDTPQNKVRVAMNWITIAAVTGSNISGDLISLVDTFKQNKHISQDDKPDETDNNPNG